MLDHKILLILSIGIIIIGMSNAHADSLFSCYPASVFKCSGNISSIGSSNGNISVISENNTNFSDYSNYGSVAGVPKSSSGSLKSFTQETISSLSSQLQSSQPQNSFLPYGMMNFYISNMTIGSSTNVTITFTKPIPVGAQYWKISNGEWIDETKNVQIIGNQLIVRLTDGGEMDEDGIANGQIIDPAGILFFNSIVPTNVDESITPSLAKPSFGDVGDIHFECGLKINGICYDVKGFKTLIPKNIFPVNKTSTIDIKIKPIYGSSNFNYATVYQNFEDEKMPATYQASLSFKYDKNQGAILSDPLHVISNFTAIKTNDLNYDYIHFSFIPKQKLPDSNLILQAVDGYRRVNNVVIYGAVQFGEDPITHPYVKPEWLHIFDNRYDLSNAVLHDGWTWNNFPSRAKDSTQIFENPSQGKLLYFYNSKDGIMSAEIFDGSNNVLWSSPYSYLQHVMPPKNSSYSNNHLNYLNETAINIAKKQQEASIPQTLDSMGLDKCNYIAICGSVTLPVVK